jgi:hypothetical protein
LTDVAEGTIVRCITRLDETCREVRDAARVIGDAELFKKMEEAQALIKRDSEWFCVFTSVDTVLMCAFFSLLGSAVVFAASLVSCGSCCLCGWRCGGG